MGKNRTSTPATGLAWRRRASWEARRTEIFRSLGLALRERGLASLTVQDIADRLGMTKGNLYYYFRNKQDLLYGCHVACMRLSLRALAEVRRSAEPPGTRLS